MLRDRDACGDLGHGERVRNSLASGAASVRRTRGSIAGLPYHAARPVWTVEGAKTDLVVV